MPAIYCLDTSSLIRAWYEAYPPDAFPSFWAKFEEAATNNDLIAPDEVLREIQKRSDDLYRWLKAHASLFVDIDDDLQSEVAAIMADFPLLAKNRKGAFAADPWVVGLAKLRSAIVVTEESRLDSKKKPKIPGVCAHYGVRSINLLAFIRDVRWSF